MSRANSMAFALLDRLDSAAIARSIAAARRVFSQETQFTSDVSAVATDVLDATEQQEEVFRRGVTQLLTLDIDLLGLMSQALERSDTGAFYVYAYTSQMLRGAVDPYLQLGVEASGRTVRIRNAINRCLVAAVTEQHGSIQKVQEALGDPDLSEAIDDLDQLTPGIRGYIDNMLEPLLLSIRTDTITGI